jgi:hypothetical protein
METRDMKMKNYVYKKYGSESKVEAETIRKSRPALRFASTASTPKFTSIMFTIYWPQCMHL